MISSTPPLHTSSSNVSHVSTSSNSNSGTRVWIKASAVDAIRVPKLTFKEKMNRNARSSANPHSHVAPHHSFSTASVTSFTSAKEFSDTDSDYGSLGFSSSGGRNQPWGWKCGFMIESTSTSNKHNGNSNMEVGGGDNIIVRLEEVTLNPVPVPPISLPSSALNDGDVVLANEYPLDNEGHPICPDDLISLTHLHEPSVVECLQNRYINDDIYTSTGPVLLALNPFQTLRGNKPGIMVPCLLTCQ